MKNYLGYKLRLESKPKNIKLLHAIIETHNSVAAFCRDAKLNPNEVGKLLNIEKSPFTKKGEYRLICTRIAKYTGFSTEYLFAPDLYSEIPGDQTFMEVSLEKVSESELHTSAETSYLYNDPAETMIIKELRYFIMQALYREISPAQYRIISCLYGLDDNEEHEYDDVADYLNVNETVIRKVEKKVFRIFRRNKRTKFLAMYLLL